MSGSMDTARSAAGIEDVGLPLGYLMRKGVDDRSSSKSIRQCCVL